MLHGLRFRDSEKGHRLKPVLQRLRFRDSERGHRLKPVLQRLRFRDSERGHRLKPVLHGLCDSFRELMNTGLSIEINTVLDAVFFQQYRIRTDLLDKHPIQ